MKSKLHTKLSVHLIDSKNNQYCTSTDNLDDLSKLQVFCTVAYRG